MPSTPGLAIDFLETQWSSINDNKLKGIAAEIRLEHHLNLPLNRLLYDYIIPGGWILTPSKNTFINPVTAGRIAIIPIPTSLSWSAGLPAVPFTAMVLAESYFRQTGIKTYFSKFDTTGSAAIETGFQVPASRAYHTTYGLHFYKIGASNLIEVQVQEVMAHFTARTDMRGFRIYPGGRINRNTPVWANVNIVTNLFWKEYARYFLQKSYTISAADLDFFIVGKSGRAYPIEFKSKTVVSNNAIGDWFGIDINPFSKLSFFVSLSNNMEALYFIEEVDLNGATIEWWAVKFSTLLKYCHWVPQSGGTAMGGGNSTTIIVPKIIFQRLLDFLPTL